MEDRSHKVLLALVMLFLFAVIVLQYVCPGTECQLLRLRALSPAAAADPYRAEDETPARFVPRFNFSADDLLRRVDFNIKGDDLIVFLHIQKTGGTTFGRHLVRNIQLEQPCECRAGQKKCTCHRPGKRETWLFSRFSTGWSCGLHADWTELTNCVPSVVDSKKEVRLRPSRKAFGEVLPAQSPVSRHTRSLDCVDSPSEHNTMGCSSLGLNFYYITILRDPVSRYLSEWRHVQRGATWKASLHVCDGRSPTTEELPSCYTGDDWSGCSLQEFMDCPYNLANNRQVRMLSDLSLVGCYNLSVMPEEQRNKVLLDSAKENLKRMAFFGLTEFQRKTQYLFEKTFNMNFISPFTQYNSTRASSVEIDRQTQQRIEALNFLDMELYDYAKDLFLQRYQYMRQKEHQEARRKRQEQRKILRAKQAHLREQGENSS
ncbi:H6ST2 sulfotransferase, partial [Melanocharis versteri]|nr:H6ST2 sulfotransferase [Melanocharis versteri]